MSTSLSDKVRIALRTIRDEHCSSNSTPHGSGGRYVSKWIQDTFCNRKRGQQQLQQVIWHGKFFGDLLREIENHKADNIIFHVFSNGGCFVWEHFRRALDNSQSFHYPVSTLKSKVKGVVFDSCPAWFGDDTSGLALALQHCSDTEKQEILDRFGSIVFSSDDGIEYRDRRQRRNQEYFQYLTDDHLDIPQLYLYCMNDPLSDCNKIDDLVAWRRQTFRGPILRKRWTDSVHCAHLVKHQNEYKQQIAEFTALVLRNSKL